MKGFYTVKDLIEHLKKFDENMPLQIINAGKGYAYPCTLPSESNVGYYGNSSEFSNPELREYEEQGKKMLTFHC
jgi:hypothetical protein